MTLDIPALELAAATRAASPWMPSKPQSGHLGLPLGCAEIGAVLYGHALRHYPGRPRWLNRDRFVLSAGHGSMFLYGWLHLCGYDVAIRSDQEFPPASQHNSGHPEFHETPGVEATTGPLGQGVANAVGYAISRRWPQRGSTPLRTRFSTTMWSASPATAACRKACRQEAVAFAGALQPR